MLLILFMVSIQIGYVFYLIYLLIKNIKSPQPRSCSKLYSFVITIVVLIFSIVISSWSTAYNYQFKRGVDLYRQGKYEHSITAFNKAVSIRNISQSFSNIADKNILEFQLFFVTESKLLFRLADSYKCVKNFAEAEKVYNQIISIDQNNFEALANLAKIVFFINNDSEKAKKIYQKLINLDCKENSFDYYSNMGLAHMVLLNYDMAVRFFNKSLLFDQNSKIVLWSLERCKSKMKDVATEEE